MNQKRNLVKVSIKKILTLEQADDIQISNNFENKKIRKFLKIVKKSFKNGLGNEVN